MTPYAAKFRKRRHHSGRNFLALAIRIGSNVFGDPLVVGINSNGHNGKHCSFDYSGSLRRTSRAATTAITSVKAGTGPMIIPAMAL